MQANEVATGGGSCGAHLKQARQAAGLTHQNVAARLKMPVRVVVALESDDWSLLGAPVFVRGQLRSYARLLGVDIEADLVQSDVAPVAPPELVSHSHTPRFQRAFEQATRRAAYIAITVAIAVPVFLATRPHLASNVAVEPLDVPAVVAESADQSPAHVRRAPVEPVQRTPLVASMASLPRAADVAETPALSLSFSGDSWVQVFGVDGESLEQGMLHAGDRLSYGEGEVERVVLGNSAVVEVRQAGSTVDVSPFSRANVARFTLSSDGSLAPVAD
ncbi:RodZ domain-containing protein [Lysobacter sp. D1-1-M9]|uniref:RodZ domain-containing protein n=1 Tax=Novilysobacter longmucuonensis TaxID=3098603 RepID=UPI002FCC7B6F